MIYLLNWQGHSWSFITVVVVVAHKGLSDVIITKQVRKQKSALNELLNSDRHVDHDKHLQSQPTSEGAYTMLSLKFLRSLCENHVGCAKCRQILRWAISVEIYLRQV